MSWREVFDELMAHSGTELRGLAYLLCGDGGGDGGGAGDDDRLFEDALVATFGRLLPPRTAKEADAMVRRTIANRYLKTLKKPPESLKTASEIWALELWLSQDATKALKALPAEVRATLVLVHYGRLPEPGAPLAALDQARCASRNGTARMYAQVAAKSGKPKPMLAERIAQRRHPGRRIAAAIRKRKRKGRPAEADRPIGRRLVT